jgi:hypothetical protein
MCVKHIRLGRSEKPVALLFCSPQNLHILAWEALGDMTKNGVTCVTEGSQ